MSILIFRGNAYEEHTKCVTEEERYSGKGFVAKEKKGERKQNTWIDLVQSVLDEQKSAPRNVLRIIETISKHNNTPRKKPKFFNFVKNVCGAKTGAKEIEQAWELISPKLAALSNANQRNQKQPEENKTNGTEENGHDTENQNNQDELSQNSQDDVQENGKVNGQEPLDDKKLTKKQRKEEKKRQKYEAELQSAEAPPEEIEQEEDSKKGKKKKNRTESLNEEPQEGKKNKRKRQDTVNSVSSNQEITENGTEVQNGMARAQKKKAKVEEEAEESMCLHDQNVAKISELTMSDKFNWHGVIMSLLQKKGNELPFKRLQKKVLAEYSESTGREIDDRIADKFIKKLKSAPNVKVDKNRVLLQD